MRIKATHRKSSFRAFVVFTGNIYADTVGGNPQVFRGQSLGGIKTSHGKASLAALAGRVFHVNPYPVGIHGKDRLSVFSLYLEKGHLIVLGSVALHLKLPGRRGVPYPHIAAGVMDVAPALLPQVGAFGHFHRIPVADGQLGAADAEGLQLVRGVGIGIVHIQVNGITI